MSSRAQGSPVQSSGETLGQVRKSLSAPVGKMEGMQGRWEIKTHHILLVVELLVQTRIRQSLSLSTYSISKSIVNEKEEKILLKNPNLEKVKVLFRFCTMY